MVELDMRMIAGWIADVLEGTASTDEIRARVAQLRTRFRDPRYCVQPEDLPTAVRDALRGLLRPYSAL
jgi:hypothetical protein